jgi:ribosomal protein S18 acetylase RimI-like enzyme
MRTIKEIRTKTDLINSHKLIRDSFKTVADDFGLTIENCPANPAFMKYSQLLKMKEEGTKMFGMFSGRKQLGFIAIERADRKTYYVERLSVLPGSRHNGFGRELMDFAFAHVKNNGGEKISVALMDNNTRLKDWYSRYGFKKTGKKEFDHLPFNVCFMEKKIK